MTYPYGLKGAPAVGGGLPGLPSRRVIVGSKKHLVLRSIVSQSGAGVLTPPSWAVMMRVAVVGAGGRARANNTTRVFSGSGAGLAATKLIKAQEIQYECPGVNSGYTPLDSRAVVGTYTLIGRGGLSGPATGSGNPIGGVGDGGDYNKQGQSGSNYQISAGNGVVIGGSAPSLPEWLISTPDGVSLVSLGSSTEASGGAGFGAFLGGLVINQGLAALALSVPAPVYGGPPTMIDNSNPQAHGGSGGGGGGAYYISSTSHAPGYGGEGMLFVQYFGEEEL